MKIRLSEPLTRLLQPPANRSNLLQTSCLALAAMPDLSLSSRILFDGVCARLVPERVETRVG